MSCRAARHHPVPRSSPVVCADCGTGPLTVFYTATTLGYHLCPVCFQSRAERGLARAADAPSPRNVHSAA